MALLSLLFYVLVKITPTQTRLAHVWPEHRCGIHAIMSLDLILFRADQGGDPGKMRDTQAKRFKDVSHVDKVIETDSQWRKRDR